MTTENIPSLASIVDLTGIHPARIWNVYLFGSQVYGNSRPSSDFDFSVVASNMQAHKEIKTETCNVHIWTPDLFVDKLMMYNMMTLECIFAPDFARLQEKTDFKSKLTFDKGRMKKFVMSQSHNSWTNAKMKIYEGDILRGTKSAFHGLRILVFGMQMAQYGKIVDFSAANRYWAELDAGNFLDWDAIKRSFLHTKIVLEKELIKA